MELQLKYGAFEHTYESLARTLEELKEILPLALFEKENSSRETEVLHIYQQLLEKSETKNIPSDFVQNICMHLDRLYALFLEKELKIAKEIIELRLSWDDQSPHAWYELGKIRYSQFIAREFENQEEIIAVFQHVIKLVEKFDKFHDMGFWAYSYIANLLLFRILSGEEALVQAMKNYNQAYRFSQMYDITAHEEFIFDDLEILQNILMNQFPLLVLIYNDSGVSLYEYLFQFVEVITQEQRFIPNFTALLSVFDERMFDMFNSTISSAYLVLENRLMVMATLNEESGKDWIKIAFIFSYLQQSIDEIEINQKILTKVKKLKQEMMADREIKNHLMNFKGRHDWDINKRIEELLQRVFASDD